MSSCRACDAPVIWALTENGKRMPLDAEPDPAGNVVLIRDGDPPVARVLGHTVDLFADDTQVRYMPHHATCPEVEQFRS